MFYKEDSSKPEPNNNIVLSQNEKRIHKAFIVEILSKLLSRAGVLALLLVVGSVFLIERTFNVTVDKSYASEDGYVSESQPTSSFNKGDSLRVRGADNYNEISYIRFNITGVSGKKVNNAKLHIFSEGNSNNSPVDVYLVPTLTTITGSTWNTRPDLVGAQKIGSLPKTNKWTWNDINLSRPVWADGPLEVALVGNGDNEVLFSSLESSSAPQLLFDTETRPAKTGIAPVVTIVATPASLTSGASVSLTWSSTNDAIGCTASGDWSGPKATNGTEVVPNLTMVKKYDFSLSCSNSVGVGSGMTNATVSAGSGIGSGNKSAPVVHIGAVPANITVGSSSTITWSSTNSPTSCTASGGWSGAKAAAGNQSTGAVLTAGSNTYTLSCSNEAGFSNASVTVVATAPNTPQLPNNPPPTNGQVVGVPFVCNGPVKNLTVRGTGSDSTALINLKSGCTGSLNFDITITSGGGDGVKVQSGAHDLTIGPSRIFCQAGVPTTFHQDGVQVQGGTNVIFNKLTVICPYVTGQGAGAFYIDGKDFGGINNVICDSCNLEHLHYAAVFTTSPTPQFGPKVDVVNSGVRNSILHQGNLTHGYYLIGGTTGLINSNNVYAPACDGSATPC